MRSRVYCSSNQVKARSRRKPPSRRSFQFQNCSPRNQSRVRMPRHTRNTLPLPLYCCYITLTPILQIRRGFPAPTYKITSNLGLFCLKIPVPHSSERDFLNNLCSEVPYLVMQMAKERIMTSPFTTALCKIYNFVTFHVNRS